MRLLVTGSSGHLGEALVRVLRSEGESVVGLDLLPSSYTDAVGSICDRATVRDAMAGADGVIHAATLHKPHIVSHDAHAFIETNISGTANLLDAAAAAGVKSFVFTSTTSAFGQSLNSGPGQAASWITEDVASVPKNIYGVTKAAAEDLCQLAYQDHGLPCAVLRIARFFPEEDDDDAARAQFGSDNSKVNELLYRRVDLADAVTACQAALVRSPSTGFRRYVISASSPFGPTDLVDLPVDAPKVVGKYFPHYYEVFAANGWKMFPTIDRVYVNARAQRELGWSPGYSFAWALDRLRMGQPANSDLARAVGRKGYHPRPITGQPIARL
jgi:UDP-glucose 4-epimerase